MSFDPASIHEYDNVIFMSMLDQDVIDLDWALNATLASSYMNCPIIPCAEDYQQFHILGHGVSIDASDFSHAWAWSPLRLSDIQVVIDNPSMYADRIMSTAGVNTCNRLAQHDIKTTVIGHPAIDIKYIFNDITPTCEEDKIGIILHKQHWDAWARPLTELGYVTIQSFWKDRSRKPREVIRDRVVQISSCSKIISTSLAGLCISHALNIPYVYSRDRENKIFSYDDITFDCFPAMEHFSYVGQDTPHCIDISEIAKVDAETLDKKIFDLGEAELLKLNSSPDVCLFDILKSVDDHAK